MRRIDDIVAAVADLSCDTRACDYADAIDAFDACFDDEHIRLMEDVCAAADARYMPHEVLTCGDIPTLVKALTALRAYRREHGLL